MNEPDHMDSSLKAMSEDEKLELAVSLAKRTDRYELGLATLRQRYPSVPEAALRSGAYHLYGELAGACVDLLAQIELDLRDPQHSAREALVYEGLVDHAAYHLYNWIQLEALFPWAREDFFRELEFLKRCLADDDVKGAQKLLETILEQFEGASAPPMPDFP